MTSSSLEVLFIQYVLFISLLFFYGILSCEYKGVKNFSLKVKMLFGIIAGFIGGIMFLITASSDLSENMLVYVLTLRVIFMVFILIYGGLITSVIAIPSIMMMRFAFLPFEEIYILSHMLIGLSIFFNLIFMYIFKMKELTRFFLFTSSVLICYFVYSLNHDATAIILIHLVIYSVIFELIIFGLLLQFKKYRERLESYDSNQKIDFLSRVYNLQSIAEIIKHNNQNNKNFIIIYLTINNYRFLNSRLQFKKINELSGKIGYSLNKAFRGIGDVGRLSSEQYCAVLYSHFNDYELIIASAEEELNKIHFTVELFEPAKKGNVSADTLLNKNQLVFYKE